jgi:DNA-binding HxlR family transcriptional regulator
MCSDRARPEDEVPVGRLRGWRPRVRATESHDDPASPLNLDKLIHERLRLGLVSALAVHERLSFNELKRLLRTTDGNLSVHARKLEDAGYLRCTKTFEGRMPRSEYTLTRAGRVALDRYCSHMDALITRTRRGLGDVAAPGVESRGSEAGTGEDT